MNRFGCLDNTHCEVGIKSWFGKYVSVGQLAINANKTEKGESETWNLDEKPNGKTIITKVDMSKLPPKFLIPTDNTSDLALVYTTTPYGSNKIKQWKFTEIDTGPLFLTQGFTIKSYHGYFLTASSDGELSLTKEFIGAGDIFKIIPKDPPQGILRNHAWSFHVTRWHCFAFIVIYLIVSNMKVSAN